MPTTQELIEKYKSEMQQMISKANINKAPESENKSQNTSPEIFKEVPPSVDVEPKPEVPPITIAPQNQTKNTFPEFVNRGDELTRRIEEILLNNSDIAFESDMPRNIAENNIPMREEPSEQLIDFSPQTEQNNENNRVENISGDRRFNNSPPANTGLTNGNQNMTTPPLTDFANLTIDVFTANRAIPIANAVIRIKNPQDNSVLAVLTTDENGSTKQIRLAAPSSQLSQTPQFSNPYVNYYADVRADGFVSQNDLRIQLFGGQNTRLPANLIPSEKI